MRRLFAVAALYRASRPEGPILGGLLVLAGVALAGGRLDGEALAAAVLMMLFSMGFAYTVNGLTDRAEDAVNKPHRPLAAGRVSLRTARAWVGVELGVALAYPWLLFASWTPRLLAWGVVAVGAAYSLPPLRLKRWPPLATLTVTLLLHLPLWLGTTLVEKALLPHPFWAATLGTCLAALPLKDIEDAAGDAAAGLGNWSVWIGERRLLALCFVSACAASALSLALGDGGAPWPALPGLVALLVGAHLLARLDRRRLYGRIVRSVVVAAALVALFGL